MSQNLLGREEREIELFQPNVQVWLERDWLRLDLRILFEDFRSLQIEKGFDFELDRILDGLDLKFIEFVNLAGFSTELWARAKGFEFYFPKRRRDLPPE